MFVQCSGLQDNTAIRSNIVTRQAEGLTPTQLQSAGSWLCRLGETTGTITCTIHCRLVFSPLFFGPNSDRWICVRMRTR